MAKLHSQSYGKSRVRILKVLREGETHTVKELEVSVMLDGDFESSYTSADNRLVVPTDTVKNTVNVLAMRRLGVETERFTLLLAQHFLEKYSQVKKVIATTSERVWDRLSVGGAPHSHSFVGSGRATPLTRVIASDRSTVVQSGLRDLLILKSAASGFEGFPRCDLTTLAETPDRILATSLSATWTWSAEPAGYADANRAVEEALLRPFAENFSPSVQATLFEMGEAALEAAPEISRIELAAPNKHYLLINLKPFDLENPNSLFLPTDEPHGQIEAIVER